MSSFDEICKEVIVLSDIIFKQEFRACFVQHYALKIKQLKDESNGVSVNILQRLQSKLLQPLKFHLKKTNNSSDKCVILEALVFLVNLTRVSDVNEFFDLYTLAFFQIFKGVNTSYQQSEELKLSVLELCTLLMKNLTEKVLENVFIEEHGAKISLGISISVSIVKEERSIKLRLAALDFLLAASKYDCDLESSKKIGDIFAMYLPGLLAPLLEVITRDEAQHHLITVKALKCWGHILSLVLTDLNSNESPTDNEVLKEWLAIPKEPTPKTLDLNKILKENKRTQDWLEAAATAIHPLIEKIAKVRKHSHFQVRLELTKVMTKLLKYCLNNLKNSLTPMIEVLVGSTVDEDEQVKKTAEKALKQFEGDCEKRSIKVFISVMEENLYCLITKLPRVIKSGDERLILPTLKSLSGYLGILGRLNRLQQLLSLSATLRKLVLVVQISFELDLYPEISYQDFSVWDNESNSNTWTKPWKRFRHFADKEIEAQLENICRIYGKFGQAEAVFDYLLDSFKENLEARKEILLVMSEVILGCENMPDHVAKQLVDFYMDHNNLYLPLQVDGFDCVNLRQAQNNIIKVALILEGVGKLARNLQKPFDSYLLNTLYYVLERMGSSYAIIRGAATVSCTDIANACGLNGSISCLIKNNVDYLTYHLTVKLKRNDASVFDVVTVLMKNSPFETMPNLEEVINSVLKSSSQNYDSPHTISYLRLFQTFVLCVNKWIKTPNTSPKKAKTSTESIQETEVDQLLKFLKSTQPEREEEMEEPFEPESETEEFPTEPEPPPLPRHIKMTVAVSNHCLHYLSSKDKNKKLIVLEILNESIWILADWENELLPLVHKIWSPLVTRFDDINDPLIINRSFTLLCSLCHTSKSFIRSRTLKNVLPTLKSFLTKQAAKSRLKDSSSGYFFTQNFKLQREILENVGKLTRSLELFEKQLDSVAESALPYLSSYQAKVLQEKCVILFCDLKAYDPYLVYFKIHNLMEKPEYSKNVELILNKKL